ncbi:MAG: hypothetical protein CSA58_12480 [Micrococcales bacterium]|nr:MAG: hypothetical protein CSB46_08755 [Micrococcales bacterium]PIE25866.1 MAG: hypothetical protein CSA58_12480 [Micrococcales bacterium]
MRYDFPVPDQALRRDGTTAAAYSSVITWAFFIYAVSPMLPLLRDELGVTSSVVALHSLALSAGGVAAGVVGPALVHRFTRGGAATGGVMGLAVGTAVLIIGSLAPSGALLFTVPAMGLAGVTGGLALNVCATTLQDHHTPYGSTMVTEANAAAATIGLTSPLLVGWTTNLGWTWRPAVGVAGVLALLTAWLIRRHRNVPAYLVTGPAPQRPRTHSGRVTRRFPLPYWLVLLGGVAGVSVEFAAASWAPDLVGERTGLAPSQATATASGVIAGMAAGRWLLSAFTRRRSPVSLYLAGSVVALTGWALAWTSTSTPLAVAGLVLLGLGIAGHFPLCASMVMMLSPGRTDLAVGVMSVFFGTALGLGPFTLAALADTTGTHTAFLAVPAALLTGGAAVAVAGRGALASGTGTP